MDELKRTRVKAAEYNLHEANLGDLVEMREGDALITLRELDAPVDLLFPDGWKDTHLPVLKIMEPHSRQGALVTADDPDTPH